jgi:exopolysaccharide biosynthesis polyprenyl glycosylphosphotransferase
VLLDIDGGQAGSTEPRATGRVRDPRGSARPTTAPWVRRYRGWLIACESVLAAVAGAVVVLTRPGLVEPARPLFVAAVCLVAAWPLALAVTGSYSQSVFGLGSDEYRRVGRAGIMLLATAGLTSYAAELDLSRALVVGAFPVLIMATLLTRYTARRVLHRLRSRGVCTKRVLVAGRGGSVVDLVDQMRRESHAGLEVVGACVPAADRDRVAARLGVPVAALDEVVGLAGQLEVDTIAVTSASETAAHFLRRLSWDLEGTGIELLVAPGLVEVAGPRLHIRPLEGLPLLAVEQPHFEGWRRVTKGILDRVVALLVIVLMAPVFVAIAAMVRFTSPGPVFYRQERIGINGATFTMFKFRSMVVDADRALVDLQDANISDGPLFKMREDPRVTSVGRWLRRLSLDELPQLWNVVNGTMSLVGPRPPLPSEVAQYNSSDSRRLLVKPGLTGLWQISGRSDLSWEESVRLDLRYVENWSLALDALILWKTMAVVIKARGAY